jgi:putative peptidoglycan lipid II flippase
MGLLQFMTLINLRFASGLGDGALSYLYWADRLLELPLSLVSVSLGSALLPTLSRLWNENLQEQMSKTANFYLRLNLFVAVPAAFGLYFLAGPIVEALFLRGQFTAADAAGTASVVRVYAFLLIAASCIRVMVPSYYAVKDVWYPSLVTVVCLAIHFVLASRLADQGLQELMVAALMSASLAVGLLLVGYQQRIGDFDFLLLVKQVSKFLLAGAGMALVVQIYQPLLEFFGPSAGVQPVVLAITIVAGALSYGALAYLMNIEELRSFAGKW